MSSPGEATREGAQPGPLVVRRGFGDEHRQRVAVLYEEAFGPKIAAAIPRPAARAAVIAGGLRPDHALVALRGDQVVGVAGFKTARGGLTGGITPSALRDELGTLGALRALLVLALMERRPASGELLMDGIAVSSAHRGTGAGTALLRATIDLARASGCRSVRLDVIDTNHAARRLYERVGFTVVRTSRFPYLRWLLGFGASTQMQFDIR